jgi:hypothetical protein
LIHLAALDIVEFTDVLTPKFLKLPLNDERFKVFLMTPSVTVSDPSPIEVNGGISRGPSVLQIPSGCEGGAQGQNSTDRPRMRSPEPPRGEVHFRVCENRSCI